MKIKDLHLVAFYVTKPKNPKMTHVKGYMLDPANHQYDERVEFTRGLQSRDQLTAGIVLNLAKKTVVKNKFNADQRDFDALFKYFLDAYPSYVTKVMETLDAVYLAQFLPKEQDKSEVNVVDAEVTEVTE